MSGRSLRWIDDGRPGALCPVAIREWHPCVQLWGHLQTDVELAVVVTRIAAAPPGAAQVRGGGHRAAVSDEGAEQGGTVLRVRA